MILQQSASSLVVIVILSVLVSLRPTSASIIEDTQKFAEKTVNEISKKIDETSLCATNDMCNKNFFSINNYCCTVTCCNMIKYITRSEEYWSNFVYTVQNPRGINIIIGVSLAIIVLLIVGLIVQLICCLCCGCCGSKKYVIVRGD